MFQNKIMCNTLCFFVDGGAHYGLEKGRGRGGRTRPKESGDYTHTNEGSRRNHSPSPWTGWWGYRWSNANVPNPCECAGVRVEMIERASSQGRREQLDQNRGGRGGVDAEDRDIR